MLVLCAELDEHFPVDVAQQWERRLRESSMPARLVHFPGTSHGFAVRDDGPPHGVAERQRALPETVAFLRQRAAV